MWFWSVYFYVFWVCIVVGFFDIGHGGGCSMLDFVCCVMSVGVMSGVDMMSIDVVSIGGRIVHGHEFVVC